MAVLHRVRVGERSGQDMTVARSFRAVLRSMTPLRDERLDVQLRAMSALGAKRRSVLDVHVS
jgi:hypothetical protein